MRVRVTAGRGGRVVGMDGRVDERTDGRVGSSRADHCEWRPNR
jgi:hypothetical protein